MATRTNKKLQVFVSSTFDDLKDERQAAVQAILKAGHVPAGMELFTAGDEEQMKVIKRWIDDSDVFMLLVGGRYGSIEPVSKKSYTHLEWDYAVETNKRLFAVVMNDDALILKSVEKKLLPVLEKDHPELFQEFRTTVRATRLVAHWSNETEVKLAVYESLGEFAKDATLCGWVPGDRVIGPEVMNEMARLSEENKELRNRVEKRDTPFDVRFEPYTCQLVCWNSRPTERGDWMCTLNSRIHAVTRGGSTAGFSDQSASILIRGLGDAEIEGRCEFFQTDGRSPLVSINRPTEFSITHKSELHLSIDDVSRCKPHVAIKLADLAFNHPYEVNIPLEKTDENGGATTWSFVKKH